MSISTLFIHRPVGTTLLTIAIALAGIIGYLLLPVAPLPETDSPTISVFAGLPGASPETMASSVATPLERQLGRIAGITEMTSSSSLGSTSISLVFSLNRDINAAARDVQAAINAAASQLPAGLPSAPGYRKTNPADAPILILALTSERYNRGQLYDFASSVLQQKLSQVEGVGQVAVWGGAAPAVRVELNPGALNGRGLALEDVRAALATANANNPKGSVADPRRTWSLYTTDQIYAASEYRPLIIAFRNGAPVRLEDVATVTDSVENTHTSGIFNGKPSIMIAIFRSPGANIISTVDNITGLMPQLQASLPAGMSLQVGVDRSTTVRASVGDVEITMLISICLVILVVFFFLRDVRSTAIPSVVVPVSLLGTLGVMYLVGYSLDDLSLMALTIATGFVVDDAIVVIENITRYMEHGMAPLAAALKGAREIGFTVVSMSLSLIAVFIPILLLGGLVGRLFREFAVTLAVAVSVSMVASLTVTPMMCAHLLRDRSRMHHNWIYRLSEGFFNLIHRGYEKSLRGVLRHPLATLIVTFITIGLNGYLFYKIPKDFFPQQDTGRLTGSIVADQNMSSEGMVRLLNQFDKRIRQDPAVDAVLGFAPAGTTNNAHVFINLKPLKQRGLSIDQVRDRLVRELAGIPGAALRIAPVQDLRFGGRPANLQYQYALQGDSFDDLYLWAPRLLEKVRTLPSIAQAESDQQNHGSQTTVTLDRSLAGRLNISAQAMDDALYDAFGQRQVSTMYKSLNQYHVVMEVDPRFGRDPSVLDLLYVRTNAGTLVPLSSFAHYVDSNTALSVAHQGQFPCVTLAFNLKPGVALSDAITQIQNAQRDLGVPATIHGSFAGTAQIYQDTFATLPYLIVAAIVAIYIVLGMLYENLIHPVTILSTLPSAGVGAFLALLLFKISFTLIAFIGVILLIGIVKKNAIMMIDFAIGAERNEGKSPRDAIFEAAVLRFRPITMTTMAALLGGLPLALGGGVGSEFRRPLGIAIVGGLIFSQAMTLYTTPVIYLYLDRFRLWCRSLLRPLPPPATSISPEVAP